MNILIVNLLRLGDVIFSLPIAKNLRFNFNNAKICYLVRENIVDIFKYAPYVDKAYGYKSKVNLLSNLREFKKFEHVIFIMEKDIFRLKVFSLLGVKRRIGFPLSENIQNYLTDALDWDEKFGGMEKLFLRLLKPFEISGLNNPIPELYPLEKELKHFEFNLPKNAKKIVIHTDTYAASRKWPYFQELIEKLLTEITEEIYIILTGKKKDELITKSEKILDQRGLTTLSQLAAIFNSADVVIGCDTGAIHISRALGRKTIVIYGPEDPQITVPSDNLIKLYPEVQLDCKNRSDYFGISFKNIQRCKLEKCDTMECLKIISPQRITEIIKNLLI